MAAATFTALENATAKVVKIMAAKRPIDARTLADPAEVQRILKSAREIYGHALCLCRPNALKLQIRQRAGKFHLAVWPQEGELHDGSCIFYRDELPEVEPSLAAKVQENEANQRTISLNFEVDRSALQSKPAHVDERERAEAAANIQQISSIKGLLHLIWAEAKLTRWHPQWSRDWGRTRFELLSAAERFNINGIPLSDRLYIPRPYRPDAQEAINQEWGRFTYRLRDSHINIKSGLIIAPVRDITQNERGAFVKLRHMREPIGISPSTYEALYRAHRPMFGWLDYANERGRKAEKERDAALGEWIEVERPEIVAITRVEINTRGVAWARSVHLMSVHPQIFIPANSPDEVVLINELRTRGHQFSRLLTSEKPSLRKRPMWTIKYVMDPYGQPVACAAIELLAGHQEEAVMLARRQAAEDLAKRGIPLLVWRPKGTQTERTPPLLPPLDRSDIRASGLALDAIRDSNEVFYAYGSGHLNQF